MHITLTFTDDEGDKILKLIDSLNKLDELESDIRYLSDHIEELKELIDGRNQDNAG